jgi:hypothetical protein
MNKQVAKAGHRCQSIGNTRWDDSLLAESEDYPPIFIGQRRSKSQDLMMSFLKSARVFSASAPVRPEIFPGLAGVCG